MNEKWMMDEGKNGCKRFDPIWFERKTQVLVTTY